jgi:hypothetical protein
MGVDAGRLADTEIAAIIAEASRIAGARAGSAT